MRDSQMIHRHQIKLPQRTATVFIEEKPDVVEVRLRLSRTGDCQDMPQFVKWFADLITKYDNDPRPIHTVNAMTGEQATIVGTANECVMFVQP